MTNMTSTDVHAIVERIDRRLGLIAEHEAAIRADLATLGSLSLTPPDDRLLDVSAAAVWLGISRATMFRLLRSDPELRHVKVGSRTLFRPEDLRGYTARRVAS